MSTYSGVIHGWKHGIKYNVGDIIHISNGEITQTMVVSDGQSWSLKTEITVPATYIGKSLLPKQPSYTKFHKHYGRNK